MLCCLRECVLGFVIVLAVSGVGMCLACNIISGVVNGIVLCYVLVDCLCLVLIVVVVLCMRVWPYMWRSWY